MKVITRFAPSPTGYLHIGTARTALFNWLFAKHHKGLFLLRIEDTDRVRSTEKSIKAILDGLKWLDITWDDKPTFQFSKRKRHVEIVQKLIQQEKAYYCYCTTEELIAIREKARKKGETPKCNIWRDKSSKDAPKGIRPTVRLKSSQTGKTVINDLIQGEITVSNDQLDDMIILRADGTPTYMLSAVIDDHDMQISHIIRGDDHLTNTFRQIQLFNALKWQTPKFAHIPLIHGEDGTKLSKRHNAIGIDSYIKMGFLPEAFANYLLRLGWSHGNDEIISKEQAIKWFNLESIGKSPSRFNITKLTSINSHYIRNYDNKKLLNIVKEKISKIIGTKLNSNEESKLLQGMNGLKERAKTINELVENSCFYVYKSPIPIEKKYIQLVDDQDKEHLNKINKTLKNIKYWNAIEIEESIRNLSKDINIKLAKIAHPLRIALTGKTISPSLFEILYILGKEESINRISCFLQIT